MRQFLFAIGLMCAVAAPALRRATPAHGAPDPHRADLFTTSDQCMACHNGLRASSGEDVSIGASWRTSMMANSSRDPYWQAGVRREVIDHPSAADAIQDECAACHMPMSRTEARLTGGEGRVFDHLGVGAPRDRRDSLAHDGVGCSLCHQITGENLGDASSFTGGYRVAPAAAPAPRPIFGPFRIERGLTTIMKSATGFEPSESPHVRQSELCATCHTLVTKARGPAGEMVGELPEQMPFLEWKHSAFVSEERSCQSCHMPVVEEEIPIASVLGAPRKGFARHTFVGGNSFMQRMLNRFRSQLNVPVPVEDMNAAIETTVRNLQSHTARLSIEMAEVRQGRLVAEVQVENVTGHKLPTGYPSRRAWLHVAVRDGAGRVIFESGALEPSGAITGNDHDADRLRVEPHYREISDSGQVQIYESVMRDRAGMPTTGLLSATAYVKDNRLLPRGFDKSTAGEWIAVIGTAAQDADFTGGEDGVRYVVSLGGAQGPFHIDAALRFQVIGFRWADNLRAYNSEETKRFVTYYESMASSSSEVLAMAKAVVR